MLNKDERIPGYLVTVDDGSIWLAELETKPIDAFGKPEEVSFTRISKDFILSRDTYESPDLALTVHDMSHITLIFGYRDIVDHLEIELYGPLLHSIVVTPEGELPMMRHTAHPYVNSTQRLEVRHGTSVIYLFLDGHIVTSIKNYDKQPGKVGLLSEDGEDISKVVSDLIVAPSAPRGTEPVNFKPVAKLLEKGEIAYP